MALSPLSMSGIEEWRVDGFEESLGPPQDSSGSLQLNITVKKTQRGGFYLRWTSRSDLKDFVLNPLQIFDIAAILSSQTII